MALIVGAARFLNFVYNLLSFHLLTDGHVSEKVRFDLALPVVLGHDHAHLGDADTLLKNASRDLTPVAVAPDIEGALLLALFVVVDVREAIDRPEARLKVARDVGHVGVHR